MEGEHPLQVRRTPTAQPVREIPGGRFVSSLVDQLPSLPSETARSTKIKTLRNRDPYNPMRSHLVVASTKVGERHLSQESVCRSSKWSKAKTNGGRKDVIVES